MSELQPAAASQPAPFLVSLGNIHASQDWIVTPSGTWQTKDSNVYSVDQTTVTSSIPVWAIVMTVLFIWFFFLSLLFLLAREQRVWGYVAVHVQSGTDLYVEQVPVGSAAQKQDVFHRVTYMQSLVGSARQRAGA